MYNNLTFPCCLPPTPHTKRANTPKRIRLNYPSRLRRAHEIDIASVSVYKCTEKMDKQQSSLMFVHMANMM